MSVGVLGYCGKGCLDTDSISSWLHDMLIKQRKGGCSCQDTCTVSFNSHLISFIQSICSYRGCLDQIIYSFLKIVHIRQIECKFSGQENVDGTKRMFCAKSVIVRFERMWMAQRECAKSVIKGVLAFMQKRM